MLSSEGPALAAIVDSGPPLFSSDYTTIIAIHGLIWHGASFIKLMLLAPEGNIRFIALNRRDYPGSAPYTEEEKATLARIASASSEPSSGIREEAGEFMRERGREIYDYLVNLVKRDGIPPVHREGQNTTGGIVLAGWSLGAIWALAFIVHASSFGSTDVDLSKYIRRVVLHDCAFGFSLYPPPAQIYHPLWDTSMPPEKRIERFHEWAAAYFPHGDPIAADTLVVRDDPDGPTSLKNMLFGERMESTHEPPGHIPNGSDTLIAKLCATHGLYRELKDAAFYPFSRSSPGDARDPWRDVELRVIWCDQSLWGIPWAAKGMAAELEEAKRAGTATRKVSLVRLRGGNHFAHWDFPEKMVYGCLEEDIVEV